MTTNKPGRPSVDPGDRAPTVYMKVALSPTLYDKTYDAARRLRMTVPELIRLALSRELTRPDR